MANNRKERLEERALRCCCKQCGGSLETRIVIFNRYGGSGIELYCPHCEKIEYGTEKEIYEAAKEFVDSIGFNYYLDLEENERSYMLNIAKVCEIMGWGARYWGILNEKGFLRNQEEKVD